MMQGGIIVVLVTAWLLTVAFLLLVYRGPLLRGWREPVLRHPVLIVESDDWGPGPDDDALRLRDLARLLAKHRDRRGRGAVATIAVILSLPAPGGCRIDQRTRVFERLTLADPRFRAVREALLEGSEQGSFALQLHGMEHYWPPALLETATRDPAIERWIAASPSCRTETLPAALQMRWSNASQLPSQPIPGVDIERAVAEEVGAFTAILGRPPEVVVPPTFVWDAAVESAWARVGVRTVVTPGRRFVGRDSSGRLVEDPGCRPYNGGSGENAVTYVVRDRYFEPARGHRVEDALRALDEKTRAGRPTLLETHRDNFTEERKAADSLREIDRLLGTAIQRFPGLQFMSTAELASALRSRDGVLVESRLAPRIHAWLVRLGESARLRKLAWATGLAFVAWIVLAATRPVDQPGFASQSLAR